MQVFWPDSFSWPNFGIYITDSDLLGSLTHANFFIRAVFNGYFATTVQFHNTLQLSIIVQFNISKFKFRSTLNDKKFIMFFIYFINFNYNHNNIMPKYYLGHFGFNGTARSKSEGMRGWPKNELTFIMLQIP